MKTYHFVLTASTTIEAKNDKEAIDIIMEDAMHHILDNPNYDVTEITNDVGEIIYD